MHERAQKTIVTSRNSLTGFQCSRLQEKAVQNRKIKLTTDRMMNSQRRIMELLQRVALPSNALSPFSEEEKMVREPTCTSYSSSNSRTCSKSTSKFVV